MRWPNATVYPWHFSYWVSCWRKQFEPLLNKKIFPKNVYDLLSNISALLSLLNSMFKNKTTLVTTGVLSTWRFGFRILSLNSGEKPLIRIIYSLLLNISPAHISLVLKDGEWIRFLFLLSCTQLWKFVYCIFQVGFLYDDCCRNPSDLRFSRKLRKWNSEFNSASIVNVIKWWQLLNFVMTSSPIVMSGYRHLLCRYHYEFLKYFIKVPVFRHRWSKQHPYIFYKNRNDLFLIKLFSSLGIRQSDRRGPNRDALATLFICLYRSSLNLNYTLKVQRRNSFFRKLLYTKVDLFNVNITI